MGMVLILKCLTNASRERILSDPKEISLCLDMDFDEEEVEVEPERDPHFDEPEFDIDKSWDVLCFLFCGASYGTETDERSFPASFLFPMSGVVNMSDDDFFGYGPPWIYSPREVEEIANFLDTQTTEQLRAKFTPAVMKEVDAYPSIWDEHEDAQSPEWEEEWEYFSNHLSELKQFVRDTADRNLALLFYLS